jgi:hypothetical protein
MTNPRPIRLKVASPCKVPWSSMAGDDAIRFCGTCERHVYNLSEMTSEQTEALLGSPAGQPCVRFFQRADGTVLTADCPVGAQRVRRQRIAVGVGAGLLSALGYAGLPHGSAATVPTPVLGAPIPAPPARFAVEPPPPMPPIEIMGEAMAQPPEEMMGKIALPPEDLIELQGDVAEVE